MAVKAGLWFLTSFKFMAITDPRILIFLKAPRVGFVKTRLAQAVGAERALEVYRQLVEGQLQRLETVEQVEIHFTPADAASEMQAWLGPDRSYHPQVEGGLGERLASAIQSSFDGGAASVFCIGGDCPALGEAQIDAAMTALNDGEDVVFGPTEDGGYYLVGLKSPQPELFQSIAWSTGTTLQSSLAVAAKLGLKVKLLERLYDVDEASDLDRALGEGYFRSVPL